MPFQRKKRGLFLFRRDLRLVDNVGLTQACIECERVFTCFIFTPEQVGAKNDYRSDAAVHFMIESLEELATDLRRAGAN